MFHPFKNITLTLATVLLFSACSSVGPGLTESPRKPDEAYNQAHNCQSDYIQPDYDALEKQLETARAKWKANEPENYYFNSSSGPDFFTQYSVSVENKQVKYARNFSPSAPPITRDLETYSVDRIFGKVVDDLKNRAGCFDYRFEFSERWGYPVSLQRISHGKTVFHLLTYEHQVTDFYFQDLAYNAQTRCYSSFIQPDWNSLQKPFEHARVLWRSKGLTNYRYKLGFSSWVPRSAFQVEVKEGKLASLVEVSTGKPPEYQDDFSYVLLDERFKRIEKTLERSHKCESISVEYDPVLGYPKSIYESLNDDGIQDAFGGSGIFDFEVTQP